MLKKEKRKKARKSRKIRKKNFFNANIIEPTGSAPGFLNLKAFFTECLCAMVRNNIAEQIPLMLKSQIATFHTATEIIKFDRILVFFIK